MTDQPEAKKRIKETEDAEVDFEGHRAKDGPSDAKAATDDDGADFEGHRQALAPEAKYKKVT